MKETPPLVTVAILNFNGKSYLEKNLPHIERLTYKNYCIVVIDNASSDDSITWLKRYHPKVKIITNNENIGFAEGYNVGLKQIESDYYLLLNTDVEVTAGLLEPLVTLLEKDEKRAVCQPKILSYEDRSKFEYAGAGGGMIDKLGYPFARGRLFFTCEKDKDQYNDEIEMFWASGACFLIKSKCFWEVNGFYDYFFMQHEETDLCWRLKIRGYKVFYSSKAEVYHFGGAHLSYKNPKKTLLNFRNNWIMLYRNLPSAYFWLYVAPLRTVLDAIASFYFLYRSNFNTFLTVYVAIFQFYRWLFSRGIKEKMYATDFLKLSGVHNRFIVIDYFLKGKRKFLDL